jgi:hypothetical protein
MGEPPSSAASSADWVKNRDRRVEPRRNLELTPVTRRYLHDSADWVKNRDRQGRAAADLERTPAD